MRKIALILVIILSLAVPGWQIAACYVANSELQSDLKDLAVQNGARIGWVSVATEDELRSAVVARAKDHGISLEPQQITVQRTMTPDVLSIFLAADYETRANLLVYSFPIHFAPSSSYSAKVIVK
jgi:hypothetical protein